jgi:hypothetical protein
VYAVSYDPSFLLAHNTLIILDLGGAYRYGFFEQTFFLTGLTGFSGYFFTFSVQEQNATSKFLANNHLVNPVHPVKNKNP